MKIKVISVDEHDVLLDISVGDVYTVTGVDMDGDYYIDPIPDDYDKSYHADSRVLFKDQVKVIRNAK
mgnify:CR=1 FL=1